MGTFFDAFALAGIAALRTAVVPAERFEVSGRTTHYQSFEDIMCSHKVGGRYVLDADKREETGGDERIHITLGDDGHVHSLQKGLKGIFSAAEFEEIMEHAPRGALSSANSSTTRQRSDHMAKRTQKAGASAKYGPRYGVSVRRRAASVSRRGAGSPPAPPSCQYQKVSRTVAGIWECSKCGHKFTGILGALHEGDRGEQPNHQKGARRAPPPRTSRSSPSKRPSITSDASRRARPVQPAKKRTQSPSPSPSRQTPAFPQPWRQRWRRP